MNYFIAEDSKINSSTFFISGLAQSSIRHHNPTPSPSTHANAESQGSTCDWSTHGSQFSDINVESNKIDNPSGNDSNFGKMRRYLRKNRDKVPSIYNSEKTLGDVYTIKFMNLGSNVSKLELTNAFSNYASLVHTKVIRKMINNSWVCYALVKFTNRDDYESAMTDMDGTFIGSSQLKITASSWTSRNCTSIHDYELE